MVINPLSGGMGHVVNGLCEWCVHVEKSGIIHCIIYKFDY